MRILRESFFYAVMFQFPPEKKRKQLCQEKKRAFQVESSDNRRPKGRQVVGVLGARVS